jgi:hypothetical protein
LNSPLIGAGYFRCLKVDARRAAEVIYIDRFELTARFASVSLPSNRDCLAFKLRKRSHADEQDSFFI